MGCCIGWLAGCPTVGWWVGSLVAGALKSSAARGLGSRRRPVCRDAVVWAGSGERGSAGPLEQSPARAQVLSAPKVRDLGLPLGLRCRQLPGRASPSHLLALVRTGRARVSRSLAAFLADGGVSLTRVCGLRRPWGGHAPSSGSSAVAGGAPGDPQARRKPSSHPDGR